MKIGCRALAFSLALSFVLITSNCDETYTAVFKLINHSGAPVLDIVLECDSTTREIAELAVNEEYVFTYSWKNLPVPYVNDFGLEDYYINGKRYGADNEKGLHVGPDGSLYANDRGIAHNDIAIITIHPDYEFSVEVK